MKEAIDEARRALESLKTARQALTGMRKNADSIEDALGTMEEGAKAALARADSLIADALDGAGRARELSVQADRAASGRCRGEDEYEQ